MHVYGRLQFRRIVWPIFVKVLFEFAMTENYGKQIYYCCNAAILFPNAKLSFLLRSIQGQRKTPQTQRAPRGPSDGSELSERREVPLPRHAKSQTFLNLSEWTALHNASDATSENFKLFSLFLRLQRLRWAR